MGWRAPAIPSAQKPPGRRSAGPREQSHDSDVHGHDPRRRHAGRPGGMGATRTDWTGLNFPVHLSHAHVARHRDASEAGGAGCGARAERRFGLRARRARATQLVVRPGVMGIRTLWKCLQFVSSSLACESFAHRSWFAPAHTDSRLFLPGRSRLFFAAPVGTEVDFSRSWFSYSPSLWS